MKSLLKLNNNYVDTFISGEFDIFKELDKTTNKKILNSEFLTIEKSYENLQHFANTKRICIK